MNPISSRFPSTWAGAGPGFGHHPGRVVNLSNAIYDRGGMVSFLKTYLTKNSTALRRDRRFEGSRQGAPSRMSLSDAIIGFLEPSNLRSPATDTIDRASKKGKPIIQDPVSDAGSCKPHILDFCRIRVY
jgi:hypothetical protein